MVYGHSRARYSSPYIHLQVLERLRPKFCLPQRPRASSDRTGRGSMTEYAVYTGLAHLVVAFWVDLELHVGVEVARRFADGANV
jgi:hypothetical protein